MRKIVAVCGLLVMRLCLLSGGGGGGTRQQQQQQPAHAVLATVVVAPLASPVETGDLIQLSATGFDAYGSPVSVTSFTWNSSDGSIAKVAADGILVAFAPGMVSISASSGQINGSLPVTVNAGITHSLGPEEIVFRWNTDR